jgi:uncharacterized protein (TIGR02246 family)
LLYIQLYKLVGRIQRREEDMHRPVCLLLAGAAMIILANGASAEELSREAVLDAVAQWEEAVNAGDTAAVADFYAEDAMLLPPGAERIEGRENIEAFWQDLIKEGTEIDLGSVAVATGGDIAYEIGTFSLTMPEAAEPITGKYIWTWERTDAGELRVTADIWNTNAAAQ